MSPRTTTHATATISIASVGALALLIACGGGTKIEEVCPSELLTCMEAGSEVCVDQDYDPMHCGACNNECASVQDAVTTCIQGQCVPIGCEAGFEDCNFDMATDGCEVDLTSSQDNCGACGVVCPSSRICVDSACVPDPNQSPFTYLRITSLETAGCSATTHDFTGQERGSMAVSPNYFYYTGFLGSARLDLANPANNPTPVTQQQTVFSDLATGTVYAFTVAGTPRTPDCDETIDGFVALDAADLSVAGAPIALSTPIPWPCDNDNAGVFNGRAQVLVHNSAGNTFAVSLPDGSVEDLGTAASLLDARACPNWALSGIAESFDADTFLVYRSTTPSAIVRHSVSTGAVESVLDLAGVDVRTLCSLGADLTQGSQRWVWHYQGHGALDNLVAPFQVAGTCPAGFETGAAP